MSEFFTELLDYTFFHKQLMLAPVFIIIYWFTILCGWFGQPLVVALIEHLVLSETHLNSNGIY